MFSSFSHHKCSPEFTLSTADFSSENTLGGHTLDVTDYTAHRLRLEYANEGVGKPTTGRHLNQPEVPARLVLFSESSASQWPSLAPVPNSQQDSSLTPNREEEEEHSGLTGAGPSRVWLVGRRPGRVRVKLAPVADSPLVRAALPQSLIKLRKQHFRHHPDNQILWEPQQNLWVTVTDNDFVWPVSITAQLVTDLTITITKKETLDRHGDRFQPSFPKSSALHESSAGRPPLTTSFGHYTAHIRFSGSRVGRSSKAAAPADTTTSGPHVGFQSPGKNETLGFGHQQSADDVRLKRVRRQPPVRALPRQGLLVVIVQFSDGSMLPWHRIMEVTWQLGLASPPYTLMVENMRPDLVRVDMPPLPHSNKAIDTTSSGLGLSKPLSRQRRLDVEKGPRSNTSYSSSSSSSSPRYSRGADSQWFSPPQDQASQANPNSAVNTFADSKVSQQNPENGNQPQWLGPTVVLLREDESFIGDLLKVNLLSNVDKRILFSAPVHASIVAARPSRRDNGGSGATAGQNGGTDRDPNQWTGTANRRPTAHIVTSSPNTFPPPERFDRPPPYWSDPPKVGTEVEAQNRHIDTSGSLDAKDFGQWQSRKLSPESSWRFAESPGRNAPLDRFKQFPESRGLQHEYDAKLLELFGSPALKDAPGMRSSGYRTADEYLAAKQFAEKTKSSPRDPSKQSSSFEASKSFGPVVIATSNLSESPSEGLKHTEDGRILVASEDSNVLLRKSGVSTNRPALELTMYILLGLFVLIALIFAVNCGAMVARYRWEHARIAKEAYRLQHLSELAMNGHQEDSAMECSSPNAARDCLSSHSEFFTETPAISLPTTWKAAFLSAWTTFSGPFSRRAGSKQHVSTDNDWVWLGCDALERRTQPMPSSRAVTKVDLLQDPEQQGEERRSILNEPQCEASWTENRPSADPQAPCSSVLLTEAVVLSMQASSDFSSAGADYHFCRPGTVQRPSAVMRPQLRSNVPSASAPPRKHRRSSAKCASCQFQDEGYARLLNAPANRSQGKSHIALPEPTGEAKQGTPHFYDSSAPAATSSLSHSQKWQANENFFIRFPDTDIKTSSGLSYTPTAYSSRSQQRNLHQASPRVGGQAGLADPHATCFGGSSNPLDSHHHFSKTHRHFPHYNWPNNMTISTPSPWVHRKYSQASVSHKFPPKMTLTPDLQRSPQCHSFGYQTLPASNLAWQECSDSEGDQPNGAAVAVSSEFETPPSPPIRTSSKLSQRISYISSGQHANLFRPVSFPSFRLDPLGPSNPVVQSPLLVNTAVNDVYTLLDPEPSLSKSTKSTAHNRFFMSRGTGCHSHDEHYPRRALSHSRVFPSLSATTPNSVSEDLQSRGFDDCPPSGDTEQVCSLRDCCKPTAFSQFSHDSKETQLPACKVAYCYHQKIQADQERTVYANCALAISPSALSRYHALLPSKHLVAGMRRSIT
ncbi:hypothetical protein SprV_0200898800 [Sparganum proliferum]